MSERIAKLSGWIPQGRPQEGKELDASRQLIREVVFSIYLQKKAILERKQMPPQPVHLSEIYLEICSRIKIARSCCDWPYAEHEKRWWDRRVNETACVSYYNDRVAKIVSPAAGYYQPNPQLFEQKLEAPT